jgi:hypothetical protein
MYLTEVCWHFGGMYYLFAGCLLGALFDSVNRLSMFLQNASAIHIPEDSSLFTAVRTLKAVCLHRVLVNYVTFLIVNISEISRAVNVKQNALCLKTKIFFRIAFSSFTDVLCSVTE